MSLVQKKNLTSTLLIIAGFIVVSALFNLPALTGKILASSDYMNWKYASEEARAWKESTGHGPLWSNSMFGGMPTYTTIPPRGANYVSYIFDILTGFLPRPANYMFLAMLSFFVLASVMKLNKWLGALGAFAYAFATYNCVILATGHETKFFDISYMPSVIAGLILLMRGRYLSGAALFGISFALSMGAGHYQIVYYLLLTLLATGIGLLIKAYKDGQLKQGIIGAVIAVVMIGIGVGPTLGNVLPTLEYSKETQRGGSDLRKEEKSGNGGGLGKQYAMAWSNAPGETFCILVPYLYGGSSRESADRLPQTSELTGPQYQELPAYWGPQSILMGPVYFGAIICFLFLLGFLVIRNKPVKWAMMAISIFAILLSMGNHLEGFNYFMFDHLPGLNKFRAPSTALVIPQLIFPIFAVWGLNEILTGKVAKEELIKNLKISAGVMGGLALILGLGGSMFFDFTTKNQADMPAQIIEALKEDRMAMARNSALLSAFFIAASAALVWLFAKDRIKAQWLIGGLALLVAADLLPVAHNYLGDKPDSAASPYKTKEDYDKAFQPRDVDRQILADKDKYYRVLDLSNGAFSDPFTSFFHKSLGGYSAAKIVYYQDLIDEHMGQGFNSEVLNMLNTKYVIVPGNGGGQQGVIPNATACGNAWFVPNLKFVNNSREFIDALKAPAIGDTAVAAPGGFKAKETGVFAAADQSKLQGITPGVDPAAYVRLTKYGLDDLSFESQNSKDGVAIFSDIYYNKGWTATIDGKDAEILRADYALRALRVPAGKHEIKFRFHPKSFEQASVLAAITSFILLALGAVAIFLQVRRKNDSNDDDSKTVQMA